MDFGAKNNIAQSLNNRGCEVTIYPAHTTAEEILSTNPDGIMLSNGPGDPKECTDIIKEIRKLYDSDTPIFAICLGHQLMALATGADTHKMKYGHRGGNHPVKDLKTNRVYISSQNHGMLLIQILWIRILQTGICKRQRRHKPKDLSMLERTSSLCSSTRKHALDHRTPVICLIDFWI